jgi:hypothetical protein
MNKQMHKRKESINSMLKLSLFIGLYINLLS